MPPAKSNVEKPFEPSSIADLLAHWQIPDLDLNGNGSTAKVSQWIDDCLEDCVRGRLYASDDGEEPRKRSVVIWLKIHAFLFEYLVQQNQSLTMAKVCTALLSALWTAKHERLVLAGIAARRQRPRWDLILLKVVKTATHTISVKTDAQRLAEEPLFRRLIEHCEELGFEGQLFLSMHGRASRMTASTLMEKIEVDFSTKVYVYHVDGSEEDCLAQLKVVQAILDKTKQ